MSQKEISRTQGFLGLDKHNVRRAHSILSRPVADYRILSFDCDTIDMQ